jgi:hypothetical protein
LSTLSSVPPGCCARGGSGAGGMVVLVDAESVAALGVCLRGV